jgi:diketogulonate reductase-like aldo/keto reductase
MANLILGARKYYANEESVGRAIRESGLARSELYITTKLNPFAKPIGSSLEKLKESLKKVGKLSARIPNSRPVLAKF